jgi:colanic acid biosynthesis glycosyl transferase WcaI
VKVTVFSLVFAPDSASTAHIVEALCEGFVDAGHEVQVLTTTPHYAKTAQAAPLVEHRGPNFTIQRQIMKQKSSSVVWRFLAWARYATGTFRRAIGSPQPDVCLVISPPLFVGISAALIRSFRKTPYVYVVQEALSDVLTNLVLIPAPAVAAIRLMESYIYKRAATVVAISPAMKALLIESGVAPERIQVIENFAFGSAEAAPASLHPSSDDLIVSYLGNLGPAQDLDTVVQAAGLSESVGWSFLVGGSGTRSTELRTKTASLPGFSVLDPMPLEKALALTTASSACLVLQSKGTGSSALPSKIYQIMAMGRPVVAVCDGNSGVAQILKTSGAGVSVEPGDSLGLAQVLQRLRNQPDEIEEMGAAGRTYVANNANQKVVTAKYIDLLEQVADQTGQKLRTAAK